MGGKRETRKASSNTIAITKSTTYDIEKKAMEKASAITTNRGSLHP
jgi:phosphohistidine swiveling domain-containing protein